MQKRKVEKQHQCLVFTLWKHSPGSLNCLEAQPGVKWWRGWEPGEDWLWSSVRAGTAVDRTPPEQICLARCWAGDRAMLQLNIPAFNPDVSSQMGDWCCGTDILEALAPPGELHIHLPLAALVPCFASVLGKLQLIQTKLWQALGLSAHTDLHAIWSSRPLFPFPSTKWPQPGAQRNN